MSQEEETAEETQASSLNYELSIERFLIYDGKVSTTGNIRRSALFTLMRYLIIFFKERFGLKLGSFNCIKVFGNNFRDFRKTMKLKIYKILCYYPENRKLLMDFLETEKSEFKRLMFFYFMTRTYEELYKGYISGNIDFPIFPNGTFRIYDFITLKKVIEEKKEKNYKNVSAFEELSKSMLYDLKTKARLRKIFKKEFNIDDIDIFEEMRNHFDEEAESSFLGLEEEY